jgi:CheY-like chemotaxis protein
VLPRVFDLFVQASGPLARSQGGLGIGLTLVRELVQLHGGSVSAASDGPGRGSTFVVRLPRIDAPADATADVPPARSVRMRRVLIVEDNAEGREMLRTVLELAGHEIAEAADGAAAIEAAQSSPPDVAIIDIGLPGIDGYEVARQVRGMGRSNTTLIALTGYGQPEDRRRSADAGFHAHITKPVDPTELVGLIEQLVEGRASG